LFRNRSSATSDEMTREEIEKLIRPFIAGVVQGIYRFKTDRAFAKRQVAKYLRIDDDKVPEETHNLFADLSERAPYIKREGIASLTQILAENDAKLASFKAESIVEDRFVRELESSGFIKTFTGRRCGNRRACHTI
jgi:hypothetical protein